MLKLTLTAALLLTASFAHAEYRWQGKPGGTPTNADLAYVRRMPTDGVIHDFLRRFACHVANQHGEDVHSSPDQYAMSDEEWRALRKRCPH